MKDKMVFLAVNRYKYDKVTDRHIDKMIFDIKSIYGDDVMFTVCLGNLRCCDFAYFEHDYKKYNCYKNRKNFETNSFVFSY